MIIETRDWMPDAAALGNPGALIADNVLPAPTGFRPLRSLAPATDATDDRPRGALSVVDDDGTTYSYAGDETKLYRLAGSSWTDASGATYTTGAQERWEFVRWRDQVLATNFSDVPQTIDIAGSTFSALTSAFKARHLAVVRDYAVAANTWDATDGNIIDRVRWSAFNDPADWTVSSVTGSDVRDLKVGGAIQRVLGGEYGVIVSERSVFRMTFTGAPTYFQIEEVLPGFGAVSPGAVAQHGDRVFFLSENGFVMLTDGATPSFIGSGRVDRTVLQDLDFSNADRMSAAVDAKGSRVIWSYPGSGTSGRPNRLVIYDWVLDRWSSGTVDLELLWRPAGISVTLEGVDSYDDNLDTLDISLDDDFWKGDSPRIGAFGADFKLSFFSGATLPAQLVTREVEPNAGQRTSLTAIRALVDGGSVSVRVGSRSSMASAVTYTSASTPRDTGRIPVRVSGRYLRTEMNLSGDWTDALGVQLDQATMRATGRRG